MEPWKLKVGDYGKIKNAEIEMAPLTLFVGDNNSGKSYLLSLLWGIENFGLDLILGNEYIHSQEVDEISEWLKEQIQEAKNNTDVEHVVSVEAIGTQLEVVLNAELKKKKNRLVQAIFNSENISIGNLEISLGEAKRNKLHFYFSKKTRKFDLFANNQRQKFGGFSVMCEDERLLNDHFVLWFLIRGIYSCIMGIGISEMDASSKIYLPAARTGFMLTKDIINKVGRKNTFNLSSDSEPITPFIRPINQFLDIMGDLTAENSGSEYKQFLADELENEMANGKVEISSMPNKEVQYVPDGHKKGIPLRLVSAVVTELTPLILILKHKARITKFYYEEPEMCLHPQLQHKMGKFICRAVNSKISMIITTHSDIIIQHINNMIKLTQRENQNDIYDELSYTERDLLSCNQVRIYQFRVTRKGKTEVTELKCGADGFVVPTFNDALMEIMEEAYKIQG